MHFLRILNWLLLIVPAFTAQAQTSIDPSKQAQDPCRADDSRFEQTIGFIRQTQGTQAAAEMKERLLPSKLENEILFKDGYCGLARYLKERKLI